jgi:hypothetical protein
MIYSRAIISTVNPNVISGITDVFADTSYYIALLNRLDTDHRKASAFRTGFSGQYLITAYVVIELVNWLC